MSISSILAQAVSAISPAALQQLAAATTSATGNSSPATSTSLSQPGQLFAQLQQLATSNPAEFKQVTAQIAAQLQQAATAAAGTSTAASGTSAASGSAATFLSNVANQFQQASQTGSAASLIPAHHGGGHHHHGGGGGGELSSLLDSSSSSSASSGTTPATTQAATTGYSAQSPNPFDQVLTIIQNALAGIGSSTTAAAA
jgi:hypothetical protein